MKSILFLAALVGSCTAKEVKAIDDFIEGEANTAEQVVQDLSGTTPASQGKVKPAVEVRLPVKKF
jgi:hypothetical protein